MGKFYEFFAGGGMARMGLGSDWTCLFSNDFDHKKSNTYRLNWGNDAFLTKDIRQVTTSDLPDQCDLAWGSFPCQDLSLAGGGAGLKGNRSGTFWPFWDLMTKLGKEGRSPKIIALENVCGTLTSHDGKDFSAICAALNKANYKCGAVVIDAALFVPQSRPRLFIIAVRNDVVLPTSLLNEYPSKIWHSRIFGKAFKNLTPSTQKNWIWWNIPNPPTRNTCFADLIEDQPTDVMWHTKDETKRLISMMSDINLAKVKKAKLAGRRIAGTIYKRTRKDENGFKVQRAEVRFDDIAGCLRTPAGGSSRQLIIVVDGNAIKTRLISARETARLMGLPDEYRLPENYNEAYHLTGDGVVVPVVRHLTEHLFEPILEQIAVSNREAA